MRNFILSAAVLAFAGLSTSQAGTINSNAFSAQDTTKKDTVQTPTDRSKKASMAYGYSNEQDTTKNETPQDTTKKKSKKKESLANDYTAEQDSTTNTQQAAEQRAEVKLTDLPDPVKTTLTADIFKEWVPSTSYHVKGDKEYYHIEVKKGEEIRSIKIGADGKVTE